MMSAKQLKTERLTVRVPPELMSSIEKAAAESGWEVSDQVRFELMQIRGMWKGPVMPDGDSPKRRDA